MDGVSSAGALESRAFILLHHLGYLRGKAREYVPGFSAFDRMIIRLFRLSYKHLPRIFSIENLTEFDDEEWGDCRLFYNQLNTTIHKNFLVRLRLIERNLTITRCFADKRMLNFLCDRYPPCLPKPTKETLFAATRSCTSLNIPEDALYLVQYGTVRWYCILNENFQESPTF
jgi:hypothetical protein